MVEFDSLMKRRLLIFLASALVGAVALQQVLKVQSATSDSPHLRRLSTELSPIASYDYRDIEKSAALFEGYYARILMFDGKNFFVYNLRDKKVNILGSPHGGRALRAISLLVEGLTTNFPERFAEGQLPFQVMYSDGDAINLGDCTSHPSKCDLKHLPPLLAHGSVPNIASNFPFIKAYPNWFYGDCIYDWKVKGKQGPCKSWPQREGVPVESAIWDELIPTLIWRGSDHAFLPHMETYKHANGERGNFPMLKTVTSQTTRDELAKELSSHYNGMTPRWRAVIKTIQADTEQNKWIDVRFYGKGGDAYHEVFNQHGVIVRDQGMDTAALSKYRYQIDLGGGGGTTWRGTIVKMAMPGVLFHHETSMKDWFYDLMIPWVHYIPVSWDLSDLYERYQWAEGNQGRCQEISRNASALSRYLMSPEYMERLYNELFRDYLGQVVAAYQPTSFERQFTGNTIRQHLIDTYEADGFEVTPVSSCDDKSCKTSWNDGKFHDVPYVISSER